MSNPSNLTELKFSDLYVSEGRCIFKQGGNPVPQELPPHLVRDGRALFDLCRDEEQRKGCEDFALDYEGLRFRAARLDSIGGLYYVLRRLPMSVPELKSLGLHPGITKRLALAGLHGLILIAGATGSGKSTTAAAIVAHRLRTIGGVCVTIEDPPEMPLNGAQGQGECYQVEVKNGDFATPCRSVLRWAPDIIFLGEIRDGVSATEAIRASINGHLVVGTIHSDNVISAIERLYGMMSNQATPDDASSMLSNGLIAVLHQKLQHQYERVHLRAQWLFFYGKDGEAPRTNVRERNFKMLVSQIDAQERRLALNIDSDLRP